MKGHKFLIAVGLMAYPINASAFDCQAFLTQGGLGDLTRHQALLVAKPNIEIPDGHDLVNVDEENAVRRRKILATNKFRLKESNASSSKYLQCRILRAGFVLKNPRVDLYLTSGKLENRADVLIFQFRELATNQTSTESWPNKLPILIRTEHKKDRGLNLSYTNFIGLKAHEKRTSPGQFVVLTSMNKNAHAFLPNGVWPGENGFAATAIALCEPVECATLFSKVEFTTQPELKVSPSELSSFFSYLRPAKKPWRTAIDAKTGAKVCVAILNHSQQAGREQNFLVANPSGPTSRFGPTQPLPVSGPIVRDGRESGVSPILTDADTGGLTCLLDSLSPGLFRPRPVCPPETSNRWGGGKFQLRPSAKNQWVMVRRERPTPKRLEIRLPSGQDGLQCQLTASYVTAARGQEVEVHFTQASSRASGQVLFAAALNEAPRIGSEGKIIFHLKVSSIADCGAPGRTAKIIANSETLSENLTPATSIATELLYLLMFNDVGHPVDGRERIALAAAMSEAVVSAHRRASHFRGRRPWALVSARIGALSPKGGELLAESSGTGLREQGASLLASIQRDRINALAGNGGRITPSAEALARGLRDLASRRKGINHVVAVLIGPADRPGILGDKHNSCTSDIYSTVKKEIDNGEGPALDLVVFPIVRVGDIARLDSLKLEPVDIVPGLPQLPGRIMRCRDLPNGIRIYPFIAEAWREPSEIARRFSVSVSDRLGALIDETLSSSRR